MKFSHMDSLGPWKDHSTPFGDTWQSQHFAVSIYTDDNISFYILDMRDEAGNLASNQAMGIDWPYRLPFKYIFNHLCFIFGDS